jgi:hypothetical protein
MPTTKHKKEEIPGITIDPNMRDYSKDPYLVAKAERARAFIAKNGLPEDKPAKIKRPKKD